MSKKRIFERNPDTGEIKEREAGNYNEHYYDFGRNGWTPTSTMDELTPDQKVMMSVPAGMEFNKPYSIDDLTSEDKQWEELKELAQKHKANRKNFPIYTGVVKYFPDALAEVSNISRIGNEQHHPGEPLHWDKSKSTDHLDALMRHLLEADEFDNDGALHLAKVAWRALAALQTKLENK